MTTKNVLARIFFAVFCLCFSACAAKRETGADLSARRIWPEGVQYFRHKLHVDIPNAPLPLRFDGILCFDTAARRIRVVGMGPFGLTLFDLSVTPDAVRTAYLHPSLSGIGGVDREVGRCVRAIWFACLGLAFSREQGGGMNDDIVREPHTEYRFTAGRLVLGTSGTWSATFSEERPWPRNIFFQSQSPAYTVRIKQIDDASLERARQ